VRRRSAGAAGDEPGDAFRCEAACVVCLGVASPRFVALVSLGLGPALGHALGAALARLPLRHLDLSGCASWVSARARAPHRRWTTFRMLASGTAWTRRRRSCR
jgi:hypothetical protein